MRRRFYSIAGGAIGGFRERQFRRGAGTAVIREDRELLAELARLNTDVVPLAMELMEGSATAQEQRVFAQRLIAAGERLHRRADDSEFGIIDGEVAVGDNRALCVDTGINTVS